jgi:hypothetical protein
MFNFRERMSLLSLLRRSSTICSWLTRLARPPLFRERAPPCDRPDHRLAARRFSCLSAAYAHSFEVSNDGLIPKTHLLGLIPRPGV